MIHSSLAELVQGIRTGADQCFARGVDSRFRFTNCHGLGVKVVHVASLEEIYRIELGTHSAILDFFDVDIAFLLRIGEPLMIKDLGCTA